MDEEIIKERKLLDGLNDSGIEKSFSCDLLFVDDNKFNGLSMKKRIVGGYNGGLIDNSTDPNTLPVNNIEDVN